MSEQNFRVEVRRWAVAAQAPFDEPVFVLDTGELPQNLANICMVLPSQGLARARELLAAGARRVLVGEAALAASSIVAVLAKEFGSARIGVYVPAKRMQVSWTMDTVSNADFRVVTPSLCEPCWEVLKSDSTRTGTMAAWWIGAMFDLGASTALVSVDMSDDQDLNICAGLLERFAERVWFSPLQDAEPNLADWVEYGKITRLVVTDDLYHKDQTILALRGVTDSTEAVT